MLLPSPPSPRCPTTPPIILVMKTLCCCPLELSGRRPLEPRAVLPHGKRGPSDPLASSPSGRADRSEPAWGSPAVPSTRRTHAPPSGVCMCSFRSFDPCVPFLGRPRVVPAAPNLSHFGQHRSFISTRPLNVRTGQEVFGFGPTCGRVVQRKRGGSRHWDNSTLGRCQAFRRGLHRAQAFPVRREARERGKQCNLAAGSWACSPDRGARACLERFWNARTPTTAGPFPPEEWK